MRRGDQRRLHSCGIVGTPLGTPLAVDARGVSLEGAAGRGREPRQRGSLLGVVRFPREFFGVTRCVERVGCDEHREDAPSGVSVHQTEREAAAVEEEEERGGDVEARRALRSPRVFILIIFAGEPPREPRGLHAVAGHLERDARRVRLRERRGRVTGVANTDEPRHLHAVAVGIAERRVDRRHVLFEGPGIFVAPRALPRGIGRGLIGLLAGALGVRGGSHVALRGCLLPRHGHRSPVRSPG